MVYHQRQLLTSTLPTKFRVLPRNMSSPISVASLVQVTSMMHYKTKQLDLLIRPPPARRICEEKVEDDPVTSIICEEQTVKNVPPPASSSRSQQPMRRRIFSEFWDRSDPKPNNKAPVQSTPLFDKELDERLSCMHICQFSPAPSVGLKTHHELLQNVLMQSSGKIPCTRELPSLPDPLRRMVSESISSKGCGMYPLLDPKPILRKSKYTSSRHCNNKGGIDESFVRAQSRERLNNDLFQSARGFSSNSLKTYGRHVTDEETRALYKQARKKQSRAIKSVSFDPRIVITEFDDQIIREWYLEHELAHLKNETIMLARKYTLLHPKVAQNLGKQSYDPVIGKMRKKKGLYSLPVLNILPEDFNIDVFNRQLDEMLFKGVKRVLIVDPSQVIQHLFCRSLQKLFPDAIFESIGNAEEALRMYTRAMGHKGGSKRAFDIMVVEENLFSRSKGRGNAKSSTVSLERMRSLGGYDSPPTRQHTPKQASLSGLDALTRRPLPERRGMTGSQLIKRINQLEDQVYNASRNKDSLRGILVGVSANLNKDREALQQSGADFIWSKPPPPLSVNLRDQLLGALISKRQGSINK